MEIILKQDVDRLGSKHDTVTVKSGSARNFLIPQGMAIAATPSAKKVVAEVIKQQAHKAAKAMEEAQALATKLEGLSLKIGAIPDKGAAHCTSEPHSPACAHTHAGLLLRKFGWRQSTPNCVLAHES